MKNGMVKTSSHSGKGTVLIEVGTVTLSPGMKKFGVQMQYKIVGYILGSGVIAGSMRL